MAIYSQLTSEQRYQIYALLKVEQTRTEIARVVATVENAAIVRYKLSACASRENRGSTKGGFQPVIGT